MLNKVILIGRLGRDPEVRYTTGGDCVATFSMVTSESWKGRDGNKQESSEWHTVICWRKLGEIAGEYLKKGSLVYVEGKIQSREYEGRDGTKRKVTEIVAKDFRMMGGKSDGNKAPDTKDNDFPTEDDDVPM